MAGKSIVSSAPGATAEEWSAALAAGLLKRLLPIVSGNKNPTLPDPSGRGVESIAWSTATAEEDGEGIRWTWKKTDNASKREFTRTGSVRTDGTAPVGYAVRMGSGLIAIDADTDDAETSARTLEALKAASGRDRIPRRIRNGSEHWAVLVRCDCGDFRKADGRISSGNHVEIRGEGCVQVFTGVHESGERQKWIDGEPVEAIDLAKAQLQDFIRRMQESGAVFDGGKNDGGELLRVGSGEESYTLADVDLEADPVFCWLRDNGLVIRRSGSKVFIHCPWGNHKGDESKTAYLAPCRANPAGGFNCFSPDCAGHKLGDLLRWMEERGFQRPDATTGLTREQANGMEFRDFQQHLSRTESGTLRDTGDNYRAIFAHPGFMPDLGYNTLTMQFVDRKAQDIPLSMEELIVRFCHAVDGAKDSKTLRSFFIAEMNNRRRAFDPLRAWIRSLPKWDGRHRLAGLFRHLGCIDSEAAKAMGLYFGTALIRRGLLPNVDQDNDAAICTSCASNDKGEKTDIMAVLEDVKGGSGKSHLLSQLMPAYSASGGFGEKKEDFARLMVQKALLVFDELSGINRIAGAEAIKERTGKVCTTYRPLYIDKQHDCYERAVRIGSCNADLKIADDEALSRRFLFLRMDERRGGDKAERLAWILENREQLYAEAVALDSYFTKNTEELEASAGRPGKRARTNIIWVLADYLEPFCRASCERKRLRDADNGNHQATARKVAERKGVMLADGLWVKLSDIYEGCGDYLDNDARRRIRRELEGSGWLFMGKKRLCGKAAAPVQAMRAPAFSKDDREEDEILADSSFRPGWLSDWMQETEEGAGV